MENKIGSKVKADVRRGEVFTRFKRFESFMVRKLDHAETKSEVTFQAYDKLVTVNAAGRVWSF